MVKLRSHTRNMIQFDVQISVLKLIDQAILYTQI